MSKPRRIYYWSELNDVLYKEMDYSIKKILAVHTRLNETVTMKYGFDLEALDDALEGAGFTAREIRVVERCLDENPCIFEPNQKP